MGQIFKAVLTSPPRLYCINTCDCFCIQSLLRRSIYHYFAMQVMLVRVFFCLAPTDKYTQAQVGVVLLRGILQREVLSGQDGNTIFALKISDGLVLYIEEKQREDREFSLFPFPLFLYSVRVTRGHGGSMIMCEIPSK